MNLHARVPQNASALSALARLLWRGCLLHFFAMTPACSGNVAIVRRARTTARPFVAEGNMLVMQKQNEAGQFVCDGFDAEDEEHARALGARRVAARNGVLVADSEIATAGFAALDFIAQHGLVFDRASLPSFLGKDQWREWIGEGAAPATEPEAAPAVEPPLTVDTLLADVPVLLDGALRFLTRARVVHVGESDCAAVDVADGGEEPAQFSMPIEVAQRYVVITFKPMYLEEADSALIALLKRLPKSSDACYGPHAVDAADLEEFLAAAAVPAHVLRARARGARLGGIPLCFRYGSRVPLRACWRCRRFGYPATVGLAALARRARCRLRAPRAPALRGASEGYAVDRRHPSCLRSHPRSRPIARPRSLLRHLSIPTRRWLLPCRGY